MELSLINGSAVMISHAGDNVIYPISGTNSFEKTVLVKIIEDDEGKPYNAFGDINRFLKTINSFDQKKIYDVHHLLIYEC